MKQVIEKKSDTQTREKLIRFTTLEINDEFYTTEKFKEIDSLLQEFAPSSQSLKEIHIFAEARFRMLKTTAMLGFMITEERLKINNPLYKYLMKEYKTEKEAAGYYDADFCKCAYKNFSVLQEKYKVNFPESAVFYNRLGTILLSFQKSQTIVLPNSTIQSEFHLKVSAIALTMVPFYIGKFTVFHQLATQSANFVQNDVPFMFLEFNPQVCLENAMAHINEVIPSIVELSRQIECITFTSIEKNKTIPKFFEDGTPTHQLVEYNISVGTTLFNLDCVLRKLYNVAIRTYNLPDLPLDKKFSSIFTISKYAKTISNNMYKIVSNLVIMNGENSRIYQTIISSRNNFTPQIWNIHIEQAAYLWDNLCLSITDDAVTEQAFKIDKANQNAAELIAEEAEEIAKKQAEIEAARTAKIVKRKTQYEQPEDNSNKKQEEEKQRQLDFPEACKFYYEQKNMHAAIKSLRQSKSTTEDLAKHLKADIFISECIMMQNACKHLSANNQQEAAESESIADNIRRDFNNALKLQEKSNARIIAELAKTNIAENKRTELNLVKENLDILREFTKALLAEKIAESHKLFEKLKAEREKRQNREGWKKDKAPEEVSSFTHLFRKLSSLIPELENLQTVPKTYVERVISSKGESLLAITSST